MRPARGVRYAVVAWVAAESADESDGDVLGEWSASSLAIAQAAMWSEVTEIFDGEFPEGKKIIVEVTACPTEDEFGNPL